MTEYLSKTFYGNTIEQWLLAFAIMIAAALVGKTLYWVFKNVLRKLVGDRWSNHVDLDIRKRPKIELEFGFD